MVAETAVVAETAWVIEAFRVVEDLAAPVPLAVLVVVVDPAEAAHEAAVHVALPAWALAGVARGEVEVVADEVMKS